MKIFGINLTILLFCLPIHNSFGQEALTVNTDYADYKELHENQELELTCKNIVDNTQTVTWIPPSNVPYEAYTLNTKVLKDGKVYTLTFKNAKREYAGKYTCKSHTTNGDPLTRDVHIGVKPKGKFLLNGKEVKSETITVNKNAILECIDDNYTYPKSVYRWDKNNVRTDEVDECNKIIILESVNYTCTLANSIGENSILISIEVLPECGVSTGCIVATICLGIIIVILMIYLIYFYNKETPKIMLKEIIFLVIVVVLLIFLIITAQLINECGELTWICGIETVISIILIPLFVIDLYFQCREQQSLWDKFCKKIGFNKTTSQEEPESGNGGPPNQEPSIPVRSAKKEEVSQSDDDSISRITTESELKPVI